MIKYDVGQHDFYTFCKLVYDELYPNINLKQQWTFDATQTFQDIVDSEKVDRGIFNLCPRLGKTTLLTILGSCWLLGRFLERKTLIISSSKLNIEGINNSVREVINTNAYKQIFSKLVIAKKNMSTVITSQGGLIDFKVAGSNAIGRGYHNIIFDDYLNPNNLASLALMTRAIMHLQAFLGRREHKPRTKVFVVEQRLSVDDTTATMLNIWQPHNIPYKHLSLPCHFDEEVQTERFNYKKNTYIDYKFNEYEVKLIKAEREVRGGGEYCWQTQYQQRPHLLEGNIIKTERFNYYSIYETNLHWRTVFMTVDCAEKEGINNDYSVACVWGVLPTQRVGITGEKYNSGIYLIDMFRGKPDYIKLKQEVYNLYHKHKYPEMQKVSISTVYVEEKVVGTALIQDLKVLGIPVAPLKADKNKVERVAGILSYLDAGCIYLPKEKKEIVDPVLYECRAFTAEMLHKHDDIVDCLVYAVRVAVSKTSIFDIDWTKASWR